MINTSFLCFARGYPEKLSSGKKRTSSNSVEFIADNYSSPLTQPLNYAARRSSWVSVLAQAWACPTALESVISWE